MTGKTEKLFQKLEEIQQQYDENFAKIMKCKKKSPRHIQLLKIERRLNMQGNHIRAKLTVTRILQKIEWRANYANL